MFFLLLIALIFLFLIFLWIFEVRNFSTMKQIFANLSNRNEINIFSILFRVNERSNLNGGDIVASVLKAHNVEEIFTLCGGHISPILVGAEKLGIHVVDVRHEATAVFAADAVARLRQDIGVAIVTAGPGITNTITAVKNAQMAESAVLIIAGAAPSLLKNRGALQDIDQLSLLKSVCKYCARVTRLKQIIPILRNAICIAKSGTPGPVFVEFPIDVLYPFTMVKKEIENNKQKKGIIQNLMNIALNAYIAREFSFDWNECPITPLPISIPFPKYHEVEKCANLIERSRRIVLLLGSQCILPPVRAHHLAKIIQDLNVPTFLSGMSRGLLGKDNKLQFRHCRKEAIREADVIILAGIVCDFRLSYGRMFPKKAKIIGINRNASELRKNHGIFWRGEILIQADVATTLLQIRDELNKRKFAGAENEWIDFLRKKDNEGYSRIINQIKETNNEKDALNPLHVLSTLDNVIPEDAILIADGGDFVGTAAYILRPRGPLQWLDPGAFGTLGVGGGFALGAKRVYPDKKVIIIYGDGSSGYSLIEFDTFVRYNMDIIAVIGNDACWSQIAREQIPMFGSAVAVNLRHTRYDEVGKGLNAHGVLLTFENKENLEAVFSRALNFSKSTPVVLNVIIGNSDFRKGSISV